MNEHAICFDCFEDEHLGETVKNDGEPLLCEVCGEDIRNAFTYEQIGEALEPIIREHFCPGPTVRKFYGDDTEGWEQEGDLLSYIAQMVLRQDVDDPDALVDALIGAEKSWSGNSEEAFYDNTSLYVQRKASSHAWMAEWQHLRDELAHRRRFFSDTARMLFGRLLESIAELYVFDKTTEQRMPVVNDLPVGTNVLRARVVRSDADLNTFIDAPARELGAPPAEKAPVGRMNAAGIAVFYGAMDTETCLAEMRPALGERVLVGGFLTTKALRILDFRRLEAARLAELSYFDPKYAELREGAVFLRRLHGLISRPVLPGGESEYLITQTLAEFLAHVYQPAFDGVIFESVQRQGGANIVLFGRDEFEPVADLAGEGLHTESLFMPSGVVGEATAVLHFPVEYVENSAKLYVTRSIEYTHHELHFSVNERSVFVHGHADEDFDEDD